MKSTSSHFHGWTARIFIGTILGMGASVAQFNTSQAEVLATQTSANAGMFTASYAAYAGQSVTTPAGASYDNIRFNFYGGESPNLTPIAIGHLYVFDAPFTQGPDFLSTSNYLAHTYALNGFSNEWVFDTTLVLEPSKTYYFYQDPNDKTGGFAFSANNNPYPGGNMFDTFGDPAPAYTNRPNHDMAFTLSGQVHVPEPSSLAVFGSLFGLLLAARGASQRHSLKA